MGDVVTNFFVAAKFIDSRSLDKSLMSNDIFVVDCDQHKYWAFKPKNLTDFDNISTKYGAIKGDQMHYLKIVKLAENHDDLGYGRISIPKRWSFGVGSEPLSTFRFVSEGEAAKQMSKSSRSAFKRERAQNVITPGRKCDNEPKKKSSKHKRRANKEKRQEVKHGDQDEKKTDNGEKKAESKEQKSVRIDDDDNEPDNSNIQTGLLAMAGVDASGKDMEVRESCLQCVLYESDIEEAKQKINHPQKQLDLSKSDLQAAKETIKDLNDELAKVRDSEGLTKKEMLDLLQANLKGTFISDKNFLKDETFLVESHRSDRIDVPEGKVYCGNGIIVSKGDLLDAAKGNTFGRRVARIIDVMYEGETHQHFLSGVAARAPPGLKIFKITDNEVKAIKKILKALPGWENMAKVDINSTNICSSIKNYTSQCLTNYLKNNGYLEKTVRKPTASRKPRRSLSESSVDTSVRGKASRKSKKRAISESSEDSDLDHDGRMPKKNKEEESSSEDNSDDDERLPKKNKGDNEEVGSSSEDSSPADD
ncbi:Myosin-7 [Frankliniella fusca]|uniref:Myosin-7 n=1 Tax=Frankliniella fusca TaxID=407009 RepID=A0AAE1H132_9NEOP|nr:Myosin-7 [Frankliniella fusca]